jgi:hypothetical protein
LVVYATSNLKYAKVGSLLKFTAPSGKVFDINNNLITGVSGTINTRDYIWASIGAVVTDGTNQGVGNLETGVGPVTLTEVIPQDAVLIKLLLRGTLQLQAQLEIVLYKQLVIIKLLDCVMTEIHKPGLLLMH